MIMGLHLSNTEKDNKFQFMTEKRRELDNQTYRDHEASENAKHKRLRKVYKDMSHLWSDYKTQRSAKNDLMKTR